MFSIVSRNTHLRRWLRESATTIPPQKWGMAKAVLVRLIVTALIAGLVALLTYLGVEGASNLVDRVIYLGPEEIWLDLGGMY